MDFLKAQYDQIQHRLAGLTASQRMLTLSLVAIAVMCVFWFVRYAGNPELIPVLDQSFNSDQILRARMKLTAGGIKYQIQGDRILVPADRQWEAIATLVSAKAMPSDTQSAISDLQKNISPFTSHAQSQEMFTQYRAATLSKIISHFEGIEQAHVMLDPTNVRRIGSSVQSSAVVSITMKDGAKVTDELVKAAANLVAGALAGLSVDRVKVIADGRHYKVPNPDDGTIAGGGEILKHLAQAEEQFTRKIERYLSPVVPNVVVSVSVDIDTESSQATRKKLDPTNLVHQPKMTSERSEETNSAPAPAGEPGGGANMGLEVVTGGGGNNTSSETREEQTEFSLDYGQSVENVSKPAGEPKLKTVSVACPRSHFVSIYKRRTGSQSEPDDVQLKPILDQELTRVRELVRGCVGFETSDGIIVEAYPDELPTFASPAPVTTAGTGLGMLNSYAKEIVVGVLAAVSIFMVSMMVRKGAAGPAMIAAREMEMPPQLQALEAIAGEVSEGDTMLDGMELDEESVRTQQVISQVQSMVKEDPDSAAALVKRWLNRT